MTPLRTAKLQLRCLIKGRKGKDFNCCGLSVLPKLELNADSHVKLEGLFVIFRAQAVINCKFKVKMVLRYLLFFGGGKKFKVFDESVKNVVVLSQCLQMDSFRYLHSILSLSLL